MSGRQLRFDSVAEPEPPGEANSHIRHYGEGAKEQAIAEGVAIDVAQSIIEDGPGTAVDLCEAVGGWAEAPQIRGLALTHRFFEVVAWERQAHAEHYRAVVGVTDDARAAAEADWPLSALDWERDTSIDSWE